MVSEAFQNEVGVHRLLSLLGLSPDCCSAQDVLLQLAAVAPGPETPLSSWQLPCFRCPGFPSWRSPSCGPFVASVLFESPTWPTPRGILPRWFQGQFLVFLFLLVVMLRLRLLSSLGFIVLAFSPYCDSSCSPHLIMIHRVRLSELVTSRETRDDCRIHCDVRACVFL